MVSISATVIAQNEPQVRRHFKHKALTADLTKATFELQSAYLQLVWSTLVLKVC